MNSLADLIPDVSLLLTLSSEKVGQQLLRLAATKQQAGIFSKDGVAGPSTLFDAHYSGGSSYAQSRREEIVLAVGERRKASC